MTKTAMVATGRLEMTAIAGQIATNHGRTSGKLTLLMPVAMAMAIAESQTSEAFPLERARRPMARLAVTNVVLRRSFPMLPAWRANA